MFSSLMVVDVFVYRYVDRVGLRDWYFDLLFNFYGVGLLDFIGHGLLYSVGHWLFYHLWDDLKLKI